MAIALGQFQKGQPAWNKGLTISGMSGKTHSEESKRKIGIGNTKKDPKSKRVDLLRHSTKFKEWRMAVFERDNYICQNCGRGIEGRVDLHPHHTREVSLYPDLIFEVSNGQTLCIKCHGALHHIDFSGRGKILECRNCGQKFKSKWGQLKQKTCSRLCKNIYQRGKASPKRGRHYPHLQRARIGHCLKCGKVYRAIGDFKQHIQKYCSRACYYNARWGFTGKEARLLNRPRVRPKQGNA